MIRLVAADMDGTLLNSRGEIPAGFGDAVRALSGNGVRFAVASGRQYEGVVNYFDGLRDEIIFLCENGARVVWRGEDIFLSEVPFPKLSEPAELIRSIPNAYPLICGTGAAWIESDDAVLLENASIYYKRLEIVPDVLEAAKHDRICKIAAFDADAPPLRRPIPGHALREMLGGPHESRRRQGARHAEAAGVFRLFAGGDDGFRRLPERRPHDGVQLLQLRDGERASGSEAALPVRNTLQRRKRRNDRHAGTFPVSLNRYLHDT